ncbi:helix-turn-helix domain-containing protein [Oxalobacteraceae bacterium OTU3REALA1]|nr:helix-turn-helix domain-containing protein [Oxalobacteraceae bacterium OTU3REALA1]
MESNISVHVDSHGDPEFMRSLARGMAVIQALCDARRPQTIAMISEKTGISRAAARRCLYTLRQLGYLSGEMSGFMLEPAILRLGYSYLSSTPLAALAQPYLDHLSRMLDESSSVAVLEDGSVMHLAGAGASPMGAATLTVGGRLPAYCTALGRVLLAHLPPAQLDAYFASTTLTAMTDRTVVTERRLRELLAEVRQTGYALDDEELEIGLLSIAVPIRRTTSGTVVAALNLGARKTSADAERLNTQFLPLLRLTSLELSHLLE